MEGGPHIMQRDRTRKFYRDNPKVGKNQWELMSYDRLPYNEEFNTKNSSIYSVLCYFSVTVIKKHWGSTKINETYKNSWVQKQNEMWDGKEIWNYTRHKR